MRQVLYGRWFDAAAACSQDVRVGIAAGVVGGYAFAGIADSYVAGMRMPGRLPLLAAAATLGAAAVFASPMPAARASRVDVLQALRSALAGTRLVRRRAQRGGGSAPALKGSITHGVCQRRVFF